MDNLRGQRVWKDISEGSETFQVCACFKANSSGKGAQEYFSLPYYVVGFSIASIIISIQFTAYWNSNLQMLDYQLLHKIFKFFDLSYIRNNGSR